MTACVFVDTNIFIYARDSREPLKQGLAEEWLERLWQQRTGRTSVQVLNECYWNLTRKITPPLPADKAWDLVHSLFEWKRHAHDDIAGREIIEGELLEARDDSVADAGCIR